MGFVPCCPPYSFEYNAERSAYSYVIPHQKGAFENRNCDYEKT